jgi:hypothetical protein
MNTNSIYLLALGTGTLLSSFAVPVASLPLQALSFGLFVASEVRYRYEVRYLVPLETRRHQAWQETLDYAFEHQTGAAQAYATNRLDWRYRQLNTRLHLRGSIREKYLQLFTQSQPQGVGERGHLQVKRLIPLWIVQFSHSRRSQCRQPQAQLLQRHLSKPLRLNCLCSI